MKLQSIPRLAHQRLGALIVVPFALVTVASIVAIFSLSFFSGFDPILPDDDPYMQRLRETRATFGAEALIVGAVEIRGTLDTEDLDRIDRVTRLAGEVDGGSVVSPTNLRDLFLNGSTLEERRLYDPHAESQEQMLDRLRETPLFRRLLLSADGRAALLYFVPDPGVVDVDYAARLLTALADEDVRLSADSVFRRITATTAIPELIAIGLLALGIVVVIEVFITRSVVAGLLLTSVSFIPSIWTLGLFAVVGTPISVSTLPIPVIVLVLATSYSIHVYRHVAAVDFDVRGALDDVTGVVAAAGVTTVFGFLCLTVVPSTFLREVSWLIVFGTVGALVCALFLLPRLLSWWVAHRRPRVSLRPPRRTPGSVGSPGTRLALLGVVILLFAIGVPNVRSRQSFRDAFEPSHPISRTVTYFQERTGADHELELIVDTGREYGLVDPDVYSAISQLQERLARPDLSVQSVSYVDFVEWFIGRLEGSVEPVSPMTDADIGEAMELLSGRDTLLGLDSLASVSWSEGRIVLFAPVAMRQERFRPMTIRDDGQDSSILRAIEAQARRFLPDADIALLGVPVQNIRQTTYLVRSQVISLSLFAAFLIVFLLAVFRSLPWALVATLPTAVGVIVYYGLLGWLGLLNDPTHILMICALLGVSNDDVLYFLIVYRRERASDDHAGALGETLHRTGVPIVQTTVIIAAGISVFYGSSIRYLGEAAFVLTAALGAATATTLLVVPAILKWLPCTRNAATIRYRRHA